MAAGADAEMRALVEDEMRELDARLEPRGSNCQRLLLPKDSDDSNIFLEIRAGTGGDEAALFAGDLFRMYSAMPSGAAGRSRS